MTNGSEREEPGVPARAPDVPPGAGEKPEERELGGRYIEGSYGAAGREAGRSADDVEGRYIEGNYGAAGREGGIPEPLGEKATESGRFVRADYGKAGKASGRSAETEVGRYAEGDYGRAGKRGPSREGKTKG